MPVLLAALLAVVALLFSASPAAAHDTPEPVGPSCQYDMAWQLRSGALVDAGAVPERQVRRSVLTVLDHLDGGILPVQVDREDRKRPSYGPDRAPMVDGATFRPDDLHVVMRGAVRYEDVRRVTIGAGAERRVCESS